MQMMGREAQGQEPTALPHFVAPNLLTILQPFAPSHLLLFLLGTVLAFLVILLALALADPLSFAAPPVQHPNQLHNWRGTPLFRAPHCALLLSAPLPLHLSTNPHHPFPGAPPSSKHGRVASHCLPRLIPNITALFHLTSSVSFPSPTLLFCPYLVRYLFVARPFASTFFPSQPRSPSTRAINFELAALTFPFCRNLTPESQPYLAAPLLSTAIPSTCPARTLGHHRLTPNIVRTASRQRAQNR